MNNFYLVSLSLKFIQKRRQNSSKGVSELHIEDCVNDGIEGWVEPAQESENF